MKSYQLDGSAIHSRKEFHQQIHSLMSFPDYYGNNLDALNDVLTDIGEDTCLTIAQAAALEENLGHYYLSLLKVLNHVSKENPHFTYELA